MREAVRFLTKVFDRSISDVAIIVTAEADGNKEIIVGYLTSVHDYIEKLINKVKEGDNE